MNRKLRKLLEKMDSQRGISLPGDVLKSLLNKFREAVNECLKQRKEVFVLECCHIARDIWLKTHVFASDDPILLSKRMLRRVIRQLNEGILKLQKASLNSRSSANLIERLRYYSGIISQLELGGLPRVEETLNQYKS